MTEEAKGNRFADTTITDSEKGMVHDAEARTTEAATSTVSCPPRRATPGRVLFAPAPSRPPRCSSLKTEGTARQWKAPGGVDATAGGIEGRGARTLTGSASAAARVSALGK